MEKRTTVSYFRTATFQDTENFTVHNEQKLNNIIINYSHKVPTISSNLTTRTENL